MKKILKAITAVCQIGQINLVDIGARWGVQRPWNNLPWNNLKYFGFDADAEECTRLNNANKHRAVKYIPAALSDSESDANLHLTAEEGCSSLFEPNFKIINRYFLKENWLIKKKIALKTTTLASVFKSNGIIPDFIKIDTQGAELNILNGAGGFIDNVIGLELEVEFVELYKGQPLFSDVDSYVRGKGFELFDLNRYWANSSAIGKYHLSRGQIVFGDAVYFRSPDSFYSLSLSDAQRKEKLLKLVVILSLYGFFDAAVDYIRHDSSPLTSDEQAELLQALSNTCALPCWQRLILNNKAAAKFGRLFKVIGNILSFPLNTYGWGTDYNGVDGRFPYFRKERKYF